MDVNTFSFIKLSTHPPTTLRTHILPPIDTCIQYLKLSGELHRAVKLVVMGMRGGPSNSELANVKLEFVELIHVRQHRREQTV